jgi:hypothetical protein
MGPRVRGDDVWRARSSSTNCFGFNCQTATHFAATASRSRRVSHASFVRHVRPKIRGRRECRAPAAPAASRGVKTRALVTTVVPGRPAFPAQWF